MNTLTLETHSVLTPRLTRGCLALNASYEPLVVMTQKRAVRLVLEGRAEVLEVDGGNVVRSADCEMPAPAVIRLVRYVHVPRKLRGGVTNTVLFARDNYTCAYCGREKGALKSREYLTRDHVVPQRWYRENGGDANTWENCVTACSSCNNRKADRTPKEAGMALLIRPSEPHFVRLVWEVRRLTPMQKKYVAMFFGEEVAGMLS